MTRSIEHVFCTADRYPHEPLGDFQYFQYYTYCKVFQLQVGGDQRRQRAPRQQVGRCGDGLRQLRARPRLLGRRQRHPEAAAVTTGRARPWFTATPRSTTSRRQTGQRACTSTSEDTSRRRRRAATAAWAAASSIATTSTPDKSSKRRKERIRVADHQCHSVYQLHHHATRALAT